MLKQKNIAEQKLYGSLSPIEKFLYRIGIMDLPEPERTSINYAYIHNMRKESSTGNPTKLVPAISLRVQYGFAAFFVIVGTSCILSGVYYAYLSTFWFGLLKFVGVLAVTFGGALC